jgi:hypothetical protein
VRTGQTYQTKGLAIMELLLLAIIVILAVASAAGLTADSRDGADWAPSANGRRVPRRGV